MDKITVAQAAEKWGLSSRTVQNLCINGRIPGAERWGRAWMIPSNAEKPLDKRIRTAKQLKAGHPVLISPRQTPILIMSDIYNTPGSAAKCMEQLSNQPEAAALFKAWLLFVQGDAQKAVEIAKPLLHVQADFYGTLGVGSVLCACALWLNDMSLFYDGKAYMKNVKCTNENETEIRDFWLTVTESSVMDSAQYLEWFHMGNFERLPADFLPVVWYYYARHIHKMARDSVRGIIKLPAVSGKEFYQMYPYIAEPLILQIQRSGAVISEVYTRLLCAEAYLSLNDVDKAIHHLDRAIKIALPDKFYGVLAEFKGLFGNLIDDRIMLQSEEAAKTCGILYKRMMENYTQMTDRLLNPKLTSRETEIARLISFGLSNKQVAERLHISENTVKSAITSILNKTGAQNRSEIGLYIL